MKRKLIIKGVFNDEFTGYEDKESSVAFELDDLDCTCGNGKECSICKLIRKHEIKE